MAAPPWLAATPGYAGQAGQVNQFLAAHTATWIFEGALQASEVTGSASYSSTDGVYLAQEFTTGAAQTSTGYLLLQVSTVGGSPVSGTIAPLTIGLYANSSGPTGSPLASVSVHVEYVYSSPFWVPVPLPATGLAPSVSYWLVTQPVGSAAAYYAWQQSNQPYGAMTSPDGVTWTAAPYGLMYQVFTLGTGGPLQFTYEDGGARWAAFTYNSAGQLTGVSEYTAAQGPAPLTSQRSLTYTDGILTGIA